MALHGRPGACHNWGGPDGQYELQRFHHNYIQEGLNLEITEEDHCSEAQKNLSKALNHGGQPTQMFSYASTAGCQIISVLLCKANKAAIGGGVFKSRREEAKAFGIAINGTFRMNMFNMQRLEFGLISQFCHRLS